MSQTIETRNTRRHLVGTCGSWFGCYFSSTTRGTNRESSRGRGAHGTTCLTTVARRRNVAVPVIRYSASDRDVQVDQPQRIAHQHHRAKSARRAARAVRTALNFRHHPTHHQPGSTMEKATTPLGDLYVDYGTGGYGDFVYWTTRSQEVSRRRPRRRRSGASTTRTGIKSLLCSCKKADSAGRCSQ